MSATLPTLTGADASHEKKLIHAALLFALSAIAWFNISLGMLRQSAAMYGAGCYFSYLALVIGFLPGTLSRYPELVLFGAALVLWLSVGFWHLLKHRKLRAEAALLGSVLAAGVVGIQVYSSWTMLPYNVTAAAGGFALLLAGVYFVRARQRTTTASMAVWLFFVVLSAFLYAVGVTEVLRERWDLRLLEPGILLSLIAVAAVFVFDHLQVERQLRRGPHLQLDASLKDPLTSLANRRALELHGPQLLHQSQEASRPVSMIIADIDYFKQVNDTHGHLTGDAVLRKTSTVLASQVRKSDLVARYGGEEFVIILPGSPLVPALRLAERMRNAIESETIQYDGKEIRITASFGVTTSFPEEPMSLTAMIARADTNLYRAKHHGRNCVMTDELQTDSI